MSQSVLEDFVRDYVEAAAGAWDEVEPQVYDLLLPPVANGSQLDATPQQVLRVAFDPEAIPEHPSAQLAGFGTPLIERLLTEALERGRFCQLYFLGLNMAPHDLAARARRALTLADGLDLHLESGRALYFPQAFFWFRATFLSDQKEQEILPAALDLHQARQVRHRDRLLDPHRLSEAAPVALAAARRLSLTAAYPLAQEEVLRTLSTMAHARDRELKERLHRQVSRMERYYMDMRQELAAAPTRSKDAAEAEAKLAGRRQALEREERLRIAELKQKSELHVRVKLLTTVVVQQPKLLLRGTLDIPKQAPHPLELTWDPLLEAVEAINCPGCKMPTFRLGYERIQGITCPGCAKGISKAL